MAQQLSRRLTVSYGAGAIGNGVFVTVPGLLLLFYMTNILGIGAGLASAALFVPKLWDAFANPLMGGISDRTTNRYGKRRPFMLVGGLGTSLAFVLLFTAPKLGSHLASAIYVTAVFTVAMTFYAVFCVPWSAMPPEMTDDYHERTRITSVRMVLLTVGILVGGALAPTIAGADNEGKGGSASSYAWMSVVVAGILAIAFLTAWRGTRDARGTAPLTGPRATLRQQYDVVRANKPFVTLFLGYNLQAAATAAMLTGAQYVAVYVLHDAKKSTLLFVFLVAPCAVMVPLWRRFSRTRGKLLGYLLATGIFGLTAASLVFARDEAEVVIYVQMVLLGVGYAGMQLFPYAILPDLITDEHDGRAGIFTGVWQGGETIAFAVGPA
ncbi:MAG: glycoside/pentoside/hexuronide:cation symporter, family, partial [Frankiales bacterium]|nr:glycoside/pentoside/hexuronide:cation symporter, family [Frankiales bacterium]